LNLKKYIALILFLIGSFQTIFSQCNITIDVPDDLTICEPQNLVLDGDISGNYIGFEWTGTNGFYNDNQLSPSSFVNETTTFTLTGFGLLTNDLITNGDFENGNVDFSTDYMLVGPGSPECYNAGFLDCEGTYAIITDPSEGHNNFDPCGDHTTGSGLMMVVNGAPAFQQIWCQDIMVTGGQYNAFSAWAASVNPSSPAILQFSIDGNLIGNNFTLTGTTCVWEQFYEIWQAPSSGIVEICVTNQNTSTGGNDFAIDDISFFEACEIADSFMVSLNEFEVELSEPEILDCNILLTDIFADVTPDGNYEYEWSTLNGNIISSLNNLDITVDEAGVYTLLVTDENDCSEIVTIEVEQDLIDPDPEIIGPNIIDCVTPSIELEVIFSATDFEILWLDENGFILGTEDLLNVSQAGTYYVEVTDLDNGCTGVTSYTVIASTDSPISSVILDEPINCANTESYLISSSSEEAAYFIWTLPDGSNLEGENLDSLLISTEGSYQVIIETITGCITVSEINVEIIESEIETIFLIPELDCNLTLVTLGAGNMDAFSDISWTNLEGEIIELDFLDVTEPGTYYFNGIDTLGCAVTEPVIVEQNISEPELSIDDQMLSCSILEVQLNPIFSSEYESVLWTLPDGSVINQDSIIADEPGIYTIQVTGLNGCVTTLDSEVSLLSDFTDITLNASNIDCNNQYAEIILDVVSTAPYEVQWVFENDQISSTELLTVNEAGIYYLTLSSNNGCIHLDSIVVEDLSTIPVIDITSNSQTINCAFPNVTLNLDEAGLASFEWTLPNNSVSFDNPLNIDAPGTYEISVIDINGCINTSSYDITESFTQPSFMVNSAIIDCNNEEAEVNFTSSDLLEYFYQGIQIDPLNFTLPIGTHLLIGMDQNGCMDTVEYTMPVDTLLPEIMINVGNITCINPAAQLTATQHPEILSYNWFNLFGQLIAQGTDAQIDQPGSYILIAVGDNGCTETYEFEVTEDIEAPDFDIEVFEFSCLNEQVGFIVNLADPTHSISWEYQNQPIQATDTLFITEEGIYAFEITNLSNGCVSDSSYNLRDNREFIDSLSFIAQADCGAQNGTLEIVQVFGGTPNFEFRVNENILSESTTLIQEGTSTIQIIDSAGCTLDTLVELEIIDPLVLTEIDDRTVVWPSEVVLELETNRDEIEVSNINWSPPDVMDCQDCFVQSFVPEQSLTVQISAMDIFGCIDEIEVRLNLEKVIGVYFPNVFSPNGDSENDIFYGFGKEEQVKTVRSLQIYDRWGNEVFANTDFSLNDPASGWDGRISANKAAQGVYTYIAFIELVNDDVLKFIGDVTLVE